MMAVKRIQDVPIKPPRYRQNRQDPREGEGVFVNCISERNAEQVTLNGLTWNGDHRGIVEYEASTRRFPLEDTRAQGNRATRDGILGGNRTVNNPAFPGVGHGGNDSGE